jgi:hypothetical protein
MLVEVTPIVSFGLLELDEFELELEHAARTSEPAHNAVNTAPVDLNRFR